MGNMKKLGKWSLMEERERENSLGRERKGQCESNAKKNGKSLTEARRHREK